MHGSAYWLAICKQGTSKQCSLAVSSIVALHMLCSLRLLLLLLLLSHTAAVSHCCCLTLLLASCCRPLQ